ncbi:hypothetical protein JTB14_026523 [Gonioctena quinquepunctata]|nr:hypothetical protein JTB14_026523 [Gonioctena quinquepunctata]
MDHYTEQRRAELDMCGPKGLNYMKILELPENEVVKEKEATSSPLEKPQKIAKTTISNQFQALSANEPEEKTDESKQPHVGRPKNSKIAQPRTNKLMPAIIMEGIPIDKPTVERWRVIVELKHLTLMKYSREQSFAYTIRRPTQKCRII